MVNGYRFRFQSEVGIMFLDKFFKQVKSFDRKAQTKYFSCYLRWDRTRESDCIEAMSLQWFVQTLLKSITVCFVRIRTHSVIEISNFFFFFSKVVAALVALRESGDLSKEEKLNSSIPSSDIGQWTWKKRCVLIWSNSIQAFFKYVLPLLNPWVVTFSCFMSHAHLFDQLFGFHDSFFARASNINSHHHN